MSADGSLARSNDSTSTTPSTRFLGERQDYPDDNALHDDASPLGQLEFPHDQTLDTTDNGLDMRVSSLVLDRDAFRDAYNDSLGELRAKDDLILDLQSQILGLKSFVSSNSKMNEQVSDETFAEKIQRLGNGLQNWVITHFRRTKVYPSNVGKGKKDKLLLLVPTYQTLIGPSKLYLIQSIVSTILVEQIFQAYFIGLPEHEAHQLEDTQSYMERFDGANQWRAMTLGIITKEAARMLRSNTGAIIEDTLTTVNEILGPITDTEPSDTRDQVLRSLIADSIDLSRLLKVQKAVFTIQMPVIRAHERTIFNSQCMEDMSGENEDSLESREISCVTFPGILKIGNENGECLHLRNVVAKIRVLCAPD